MKVWPKKGLISCDLHWGGCRGNTKVKMQAFQCSWCRALTWAASFCSGVQERSAFSTLLFFLLKAGWV